MSLSPDRALLGWAAAWLLLGAASVPLVVLRPAVPLAALALVAAVLADALLAAREPALALARDVPDRTAREREDAVTIRLANPGRRALELSLREAVPRDLVAPEPAWPRLRLAAGGQRRLRYAIRPQVRGRRSWGPLVALVRSPLGLLRRRVAAGVGDSVLVQPETAREPLILGAYRRRLNPVGPPAVASGRSSY